MNSVVIRNKRNNFIAIALLWLAGFFVIGLLLLFLGYILYKGLSVLSFDFVFGMSKDIQAGGGVGSQIFNTFYIVFLSMLVSVPLAVGAAIYLSEYAKENKFTNFIRICIEGLASVPSIVLGLFGMIVFINFLQFGFSIIGGAMALVLLNLPLLVRVTEEALKNVPLTYREASLALGATKWQTIKKVVLPSAMPGIITGMMLTSGRAIGESAILIFTAGTTVSRHMGDFDLFASGETLAVHMWYVLSAGLVPDRLDIANGSAALLVLIVLCMNLIFLALMKFSRKHAGID